MRRTSRRAALCTLASSAVAALAGCASSLPTSTDDDPRTDRATERIDGAWQMHGATPANTRRTTASGPETEPSIEWERSVGNRLPVDPLVLDSLVYEYAPEDRETGTLEAATGERTTATPIDGATEFLLGSDGETSCLARDLADDRTDVELVGRDVETTQELWTTAAPDTMSPVPTFRNGTVYLSGFSTPWVRALDLEDGSERWTFETVDPPSGLGVAGDVVTFTVGEHLFALDPATGDRRWNVRFDDRFATAPLVTDEHIVLGTGDGGLLAVDRSGDRDWRVDVGESMTALAQDEDRLLAGTDAGIAVVDSRTEDRIAFVDTTEPVDELSVGRHRIYVTGSGSDRLTALDSTDYTEAWSVSLPDVVVGGPAVLEGAIVVRVGPWGPDADDDPSERVLALG
ncbi:PQQ-like beta-propeller repeat protein [Halobacteria archaeon AArc-m2/3/4]|uniref:PQQ-like beta-propeller repeat protein n=1 Tax=Natronoglomus mannanivorans TaxID=2979990 RepID=A0AAP3E3F9_9EURY|nr:PQQ-like beta-propeller repeat protein [Halobacteria archaeon AArc-xg1-1]MCU4973840.1 PQQ-like beta-propeller repeat protein [Halobacteria archaeon AArc-m2/3/4]